MDKSAFLFTWDGLVGELEAQSNSLTDYEAMVTPSVILAESVGKALGLTNVKILYYIDGELLGHFMVGITPDAKPDKEP